MLDFYYDLSADEIAKRMRLSYENVCVTKSRALKEMRSIMERPVKRTALCGNTYI
jgi:DNA-directed RNA polymerase specialized sigma24 family protein